MALNSSKRRLPSTLSRYWPRNVSWLSRKNGLVLVNLHGRPRDLGIDADFYGRSTQSWSLRTHQVWTSGPDSTQTAMDATVQAHGPYSVTGHQINLVKAGVAFIDFLGGTHRGESSQHI